jgi:hypothetical protein
MPIDFDDLLDDDDSIVIDPRDIFLTLDRDKAFAFPRDIQTEVMKEWFGQRDQQDTVIKLNVGSGKTLVGLLLLQSSLNEEIAPAVYIAPDKQLVDQVIAEAGTLGLEVTDDPHNTDFQSGEKILVTTIHRLFNGRSVFGVGAEGVKIKLGAVVIDDAHACIATITEQFRIELSNTHAAYKEILKIVEQDLKRQSHGRFLDIQSCDPRAIMEVPYWSWIRAQDEVMQALHTHKNNNEMIFSYPLLQDILPLCRCIISGEKMEIGPDCPPTDLVRSFSRAKRRIYMTATLADDSVLVTHFGANPDKLSDPIIPTSSQSMGERMILMPQELNPEITLKDIKGLLVDLAKDENVVVIVPSKSAANDWSDVANQTLMAANVVDGVDKLREGHVGLTVLVNRYDGIDLPHEACRVLVIYNLPEVASFSELTDMAVLSESQSGLRRQMQRIEQGMGRGVRSNDDYCVVLLAGSKLTRRVKSRDGTKLLTPATQAQLDLSKKIAKQLDGVDINGLASVIDQCLKRDPSWVKVSKKTLLKTQTKTGLALDQASVAVRLAFDTARSGDYKVAVDQLSEAVNASQDDDEKAWLMSKLAAMQHRLNPASSQKTLLAAHRLNPNVLRPMEGIAYQKLAAQKGAQAAEVQSYHQERFLEAADRLLEVNQLSDDLHFQSVTPEKFEAAIDDVARFIGLHSQRPEKQFNDEGPDNLWALPDGSFLVIECKNNATSEKGISKADLGQLDQSMSWFFKKYTKAATGTPIIIHPLHALGDGASEVEGMRIMTERDLTKVRKALTDFAKSLGDPDILNSQKQINELLAAHGFNGDEFVKRYTSKVT